MGLARWEQGLQVTDLDGLLQIAITQGHQRDGERFPHWVQGVLDHLGGGAGRSSVLTGPLEKQYEEMGKPTAMCPALDVAQTPQATPHCQLDGPES